MLKKWEELPKYMRTEAVRPYYESLSRKKFRRKSHSTRKKRPLYRRSR